MECKKCGYPMIYYGTDNGFDDKEKIEQLDYYNCSNCGYDDVKYFDLKRSNTQSQN